MLKLFLLINKFPEKWLVGNLVAYMPEDICTLPSSGTGLFTIENCLDTCT